MSSSDSKSLRTLAWVATSFTAIAAAIIALAIFDVVSFQLGLLMLVGLVALYFGCGVLVIVYRFVSKLS